MKRSPNAGRAISDLTTLRQFITGPALFAIFDSVWFPVYVGVIFSLTHGLACFRLQGLFFCWARRLLTKNDPYAVKRSGQPCAIF